MVNIFFPVIKYSGETILPVAEVHVWAAAIPDNGRAGRILSEDELVKEGQYNYFRDRQNYIFSRGMLRSFLGI